MHLSQPACGARNCVGVNGSVPLVRDIPCSNVANSAPTAQCSVTLIPACIPKDAAANPFDLMSGCVTMAYAAPADKPTNTRLSITFEEACVSSSACAEAAAKVNVSNEIPTLKNARTCMISPNCFRDGGAVGQTRQALCHDKLQMKLEAFCGAARTAQAFCTICAAPFVARCANCANSRIPVVRWSRRVL